MNVRVIITGIGAVTPLGHDMTTTWEALKRGSSNSLGFGGVNASLVLKKYRLP